jgi:hypothetical protein
MIDLVNDEIGGRYELWLDETIIAISRSMRRKIVLIDLLKIVNEC